MLVLPNIGMSALPVAGLLDPAARLANVGSEFLSNIVVVAMLAPPAGVELLCAAVVVAAGESLLAASAEPNSNFGNVILFSLVGVVPNENGFVVPDAAVDDEACCRPNVNGPGAAGAGVVVSDDVVDDAAGVVLDLYFH